MRAIPVPIRKRILDFTSGQEHAGDRAVFGLLRGGGAPRAPAIPAARHVDPQTHRCGRKTLLTEERKQRLRELLSAQPDATLAELGARMDRSFRIPRSISGCDGWAGSLKKTLAPPNATDPTWPQEGPAGMSSWPPNRWPLWCLWTKAELTPR